MKTSIKSLLVAFGITLVSFSVSLAAVNPGARPATVATYKTGIYSDTQSKLNIALDKETTGSVDIMLKDAAGKILFSQHLGKKEQTARIRLNLNDLPDGAYQVEITNGVDTTTHRLSIATKQPSTPGRLVALN